MAYASTVSAPQLLVPSLGSPSSGMANAGGGALWRYTSTADVAATVLGSAYFADGYGRGMRKGDIVFYTDMTTTAWSSHFGIYTVSAITTSSTGGVGGGSATVVSVQSTST